MVKMIVANAFSLHGAQTPRLRSPMRHGMKLILAAGFGIVIGALVFASLI